MLCAKQITVIISFLNEGDELFRTIESVRATAGDRVDIVVVDDYSDDGRDYNAELQKYGVLYHRNPERKGSSIGKEIGVSLCKTPYFLLLDSHCRMYTSDWLDRLEAELRNPDAVKTLYCLACQPFDTEDGEQDMRKPITYGAHMTYKPSCVFSLTWNNKVISKEPFDVPCILGANYVCSKEWWDYIGGHRGLRLYGREEQFVSYKSRMLGGYVKCIPSIVVGHRFRKAGARPYKCTIDEGYHNEMVVAYICAPHLFPRLLRHWESRCHKPSFEKARATFFAHLEELEYIKSEISSKCVTSFDSQDEFNTRFLRDR